MKSNKIKNKRYILSFVFYDEEPFLEAELKHTLSKEKYKIEKKSFFKNGPLSITNLKIAARNNCDIVYDSNKGNLFVAGRNWSKVNDEFLNIKKILTEKLDLELDEIIRSYELISDNQVVATGKKPREIVDNYYKDVNVDKFSDIFGEKSSNLMIRIVPHGKNPKSSNWYDLIIEPLSVRFYKVRLVYRNTNIEKVENIAQNIENVLKKVVNAVEEI